MDYGGDFSTVGPGIVRMINGLFGTEYQDEEKIWKEWRDQEALSVCLKVGGMNRYEFSLRRLDGCLQICAENRGNIFVYEKMAVGDVMQDPGAADPVFWEKSSGRVQQDIGISGKRAGRTAYQSDYSGRLLSQKTGRKWDDSFPAIFVLLYL